MPNRKLFIIQISGLRGPFEIEKYLNIVFSLQQFSVDISIRSQLISKYYQNNEYIECISFDNLFFFSELGFLHLVGVP